MKTVKIMTAFVGHSHRPVEMPSATTARYAAKRTAEVWDLDPSGEYGLVDPVGCRMIPQEDVIEPWDGKVLMLGLG